MGDFDSVSDETGFNKPIDDEALWRAICEVAGEGVEAAERPRASIDFQPPPEHQGKRWHILRWDDGAIEVAKWHRASKTWFFAGEEQTYQCTDETFECLTWMGVVDEPAERGAPITMEDMQAAWGRAFQ